MNAVESPIIDPSTNRPARREARSTNCPRCRAGKDQRVSTGYGEQHDVCRKCGYEWPDEHLAQEARR